MLSVRVYVVTCNVPFIGTVAIPVVVKVVYVVPVAVDVARSVEVDELVMFDKEETYSIMLSLVVLWEG